MELLKEVKQIIIHHTQGTDYSIDSLRDFHVNKNGWEEIGYHFVIGNGVNTEDGKIYSTRKTKYIGAHAYGSNKNSIGIALVGNFDKTLPSKKQMASLLKLIKKISKKHKIPSKNILGHKEVKGTKKSCPGKNIDMKEIRKKIK